MSSKQKRKAKAAAKAKGAAKSPDSAARELAALKVKESPRSVTGVLASHPQSRDLKVHQFNVSLHGFPLVTDAEIELSWGRRYGLIGLNGSGKSTMLQAIGEREIPIPPHFDVYLLSREAPAVDVKPVAYVTADLEDKVARLEKRAEELAEDDPESEELDDVYEQLDLLDAASAPARAAAILTGLGFTSSMLEKTCAEFSGGWRMRISLSKALFLNPSILLLDEPTNHLDIEACIWLEEYLRRFNRILILVSHSQDFLNSVCTDVMHLSQQKLVYYGGNYDTYMQTRMEKEENQMKKYQWEQGKIEHMKNYIARFGHGSAKLARQAQSREKALKRMEEGGLTEKVQKDRVASIYFPPCGELPPPIIQFTNVAFGYPDCPNLYTKLDLGVDLDSRIALVGPNGAGKSTLLKLMLDKLQPREGQLSRHQHLRIGWYHQHLTDSLDLEISPLQWIQRQFPDLVEEEVARRVIGRFGITGKAQTSKIEILSDGMKSRLCFSGIAHSNPHMLLLDEPTNHLDIETIDALAEAINAFDGGMVLVSHDFRLIGQVTDEIWEVGGGSVKVLRVDIDEYKERMRKSVSLESTGIETKKDRK